MPFAQIDLSDLSPAERVERWQAASPAHKVSGTDDMIRDTGPIGMTVWNLGPLLFASSRIGSLHLSRTSELIRHDQLDHVALAVGRGGAWRTAGNGVGFDMGPGEVSMVDLGQPLDTRLTGASALQLVIPREGLAGLDPAGAHGTILHGGAAALLSDFLIALEGRLPNLQPEDLPIVARITIDLFAATLRTNPAAVQRMGQASSLSLLQRFRRHVDDHLQDPGLTPDAIVAALRISRARLYTLLEPSGGVAAYIQMRRLARAHALLRAPEAASMPVKEIAYRVGFGSEAHFSRAFRRHFGCSPSEARASGLPHRGQTAEAAADIWLDWLRTLA